ncbi:MAG TPA: tetratricopeptide repeat protein [Nitrospiraceae bacterium]|nr:tetratricopeptide repeat protein [Nitrospiraceae bacterium]
MILQRFIRLFLIPLLIASSTTPSLAASTKIVVAEGQYVMADGDTLAGAEEKVLQRAQRRAVEEAGIYLESTFLDVEKDSGGRVSQTSSLEIRTIAAAITQTEILESRRSFENERPVFFIRIRATVNLDSLAEAVRRMKSDEQLARHFRQLQQENHQLRAQLQDLQSQPSGVRTLVIEPTGRGEAYYRTRTLLDQAIHTNNLTDKIALTSEAIDLDGRQVESLIVRGQTFLQLVSLAFSQHKKTADYEPYLYKAKADFDHAVTIDNKNAWAWLGQGDVYSWLKRTEDAATSYERVLELDPFFDVARQRLIGLYTTQARRQAEAKQWQPALGTLKKLLSTETSESWIPYQKEAYLLRSEIYVKLNQPEQAIDDLSTVIRVDPTNANALLARAKLYRERLQGRLAKDDLERACVLGSIHACEQLP